MKSFRPPELYVAPEVEVPSYIPDFSHGNGAAREALAEETEDEGTEQPTLAVVAASAPPDPVAPSDGGGGNPDPGDAPSWSAPTDVEVLEETGGPTGPCSANGQSNGGLAQVSTGGSQAINVGNSPNGWEYQAGPMRDAEVHHGGAAIDDAGTEHPSSLGYAIVQDTKALLRDNKGAKTGGKVANLTFVEVLSEANRGTKKKPKVDVQIRFRRGGGVVTAWTRKSNLKGGKLLNDKQAQKLLQEKGEPGCPETVPNTPIGYAVVQKTNSKMRDSAGLEIPGMVFPPGTFAEVLDEKTVGKKKSEQRIALVRYRHEGNAIHGWVRQSDLEGGGMLPSDRAQVLLEQKRAQIEGTVRDTELRDFDDLVDEQTPADADVATYRDRRVDALKTTAPESLTSTPVGLDGLPPELAGTLEGDPLVGDVQTAIHTKANEATFAAPGEAAQDGAGVDRAHLAAMARLTLVREATRRRLLEDIAATRGHFDPQLERFADGKDHKGLAALFAKKNKANRELRKNQRKQDRQSLPAVAWARDQLKLEDAEGATEREVSWLVACLGTVEREVKAAAKRPAEMDIGQKIPSLADLPELPSPSATWDIQTWLRDRQGHLIVAGVRDLDVESATKARPLAPKQELPVDRWVTAEDRESSSEHSTASEITVGNESWADDTSGLGSNGDGPVGYLTVALLPDLLELDLPIYADLDGAAELGKVHLGDRLPWTGRVEHVAGSAWVEVISGSKKGWVEARFTTGGGTIASELAEDRMQERVRQALTEEDLLETDPAERDPEAVLEVPRGLSVRALLVAREPEKSVPLYSDVYTAESESRVSPGTWQIFGETGPGSGDRAEIVVEGRPVYASRAEFRRVTLADKLLQLPKLSAEQHRTVRDALAHDPVYKAEPARTQEAYLRLLEIGPSDAQFASFAGPHRDDLAAVASALQQLGVPNPYPAHGYVDALERVRIERGLATDDLEALLAAMGCPGRSVSSGADVLAALGAGSAVVVPGGDVAVVTGVLDDGQLRLKGLDGVRTMASGAVTEALVLSVSAVVDGVADALVAQSAVATQNAEQRDADWHETYARTTAGESQWFLDALKKDSATATQAAELGEWLPGARDAALFVESPGDKVEEVVSRQVDSARATTPDLEAGADAGLGADWYEGKEFLISWHAEQVAIGEARTEVEVACVATLREGLRAHLARIAREDMDAAMAFMHHVESMDAVLGCTLFDESMRDVLKDALVTPGETDGMAYGKRLERAKAERERRALLPMQVSKQVAVSGDGVDEIWKAGNGQHVQVGDFGIDLTAKTYDGHVGWDALSHAADVIDTESGYKKKVTPMPSQEVLENAGLSESAARMARVRAVGGDNNQGSKVNAYDKVYASFGVLQATCHSGGDGVSRVSEILGKTLYDKEGNAREETERLRGVLGSVDLGLVKVGDSWALKVTDDEALGTCLPGKGFKKAALKALADKKRWGDADGVVSDADLKAALAYYKDPGTNRVALAIASDPRRLGALAAIFADPRIQTASAVSWTEHALLPALNYEVGGKKISEFELSERTAGTLAKLFNSAPAAAKKIARAAFADLFGSNADAKDPSKWTVDTRQGWSDYLRKRLIYWEPRVRGDKHRAVDYNGWVDKLAGSDALHSKIGEVSAPGYDKVTTAPASTHLDPLFEEEKQSDPIVDAAKYLMDKSGLSDHATVLGELNSENKAQESQRPEHIGPVLAEARKVPISLVYGPELQQKMESHRRHGQERTFATDILKCPQLRGLMTSSDVDSGLAGLWQLKRAAEFVGADRLANRVDEYLVKLEAKAGHERADPIAPGAYYGRRDYDEELAKRWMDELDEAFAQMPATVTLGNGQRVTLHVKPQYRNFKETLVHKNKDWMGVHAASVNMPKKYTSTNYSKVILNGLGTDKNKHSAEFLKAWQGKANPAELTIAIQEAIDTDPEIQQIMLAVTEEDPEKAQEQAETALYNWLFYKLGLDCVGFAWNAINGSGMYEDFTPTKVDDETGQFCDKTTMRSHKGKWGNFACEAFKKTAQQLPDPASWRTLDCLVSDKHIIVIYDVEVLSEDQAILQTRESSGTTGYRKSEYKWEKGVLKSGRDFGSVASGGTYVVCRPQNSDALNTWLDKKK